MNQALDLEGACVQSLYSSCLCILRIQLFEHNEENFYNVYLVLLIRFNIFKKFTTVYPIKFWKKKKKVKSEWKLDAPNMLRE